MNEPHFANLVFVAYFDLPYFILETLNCVQESSYVTTAFTTFRPHLLELHEDVSQPIVQSHQVLLLRGGCVEERPKRVAVCVLGAIPAGTVMHLLYTVFCTV